MNNDTQALIHRVNRLERLTKMSWMITGSLVLMMAFAFVSKSDDEGDAGAKVIRARGIVIVDEKGRDRICLGSPVPDPKGYDKRINASTGLTINDTNGYERFGMGLDATGNMIMGFDAPHDKGTPGNPERINIVADANGGAFMRFLNSKTHVVSFLRLDENDDFCMEFVDRKTGKIMRRQLRYSGENIVEWK